MIHTPSRGVGLTRGSLYMDGKFRLRGADRFLFWAHIVQAGLGLVMLVAYFNVLQSAPVWMIVGSILLPLVALVGSWLLRGGSVVGYLLFLVFNAFQLVWITTPSIQYGFSFGLRLNVSLSSPGGGALIALNLVAALLLGLTAVAWFRRLRSFAPTS